MVFIRSTSQSLHAAIDQLRPQNVERRFRELQKEFQEKNPQALTSQIRFCSPSTSTKVSDADKGEVVSVKLSESAAVKSTI